MAGRLGRDESDRLIRNFADAQADDLFRPRLALAVLCLREVAENQRNKGLVDRMTTDILDLWIEHSAQRTDIALLRITEALPAVGELSGRYHGKQVLGWLGALQPDVVFLRLVNAIGPVVATPEALARLVALIRDPNRDVRRSAADALGSLGEKAATAEVLARLVALIRDPDSSVRWSAAYALAAIQTSAPNVRIQRKKRPWQHE
jgi:hypothetical protein